jgi:hypothetical protein
MDIKDVENVEKFNSTLKNNTRRKKIKRKKISSKN